MVSQVQDDKVDLAHTARAARDLRFFFFFRKNYKERKGMKEGHDQRYYIRRSGKSSFDVLVRSFEMFALDTSYIQWIS